MLRAAFLLCLFFPGFVLGQINVRDSLARQLRADSARIFRTTIAKPYLRLENRHSFLVKDHVNFFGFLAGVNLYERHVIAGGYYFLGKGSKKFIDLEDHKGEQRFSDFGYFDFAYQYIAVTTRYVQVNVPIEVGYGAFKATVRDSLDRKISDVSGHFIPLASGIQLIIRPLRRIPWAGLSASGGYRYVKHSALRLSFNGFYYSFGVWVDARQVQRQLRYNYRKRQYRRAIAAQASGNTGA